MRKPLAVTFVVLAAGALLLNAAWPPAALARSVSRRNGLPAAPRGWAPPVKSNRWECIVVHHSATDFGGARRFDKGHKNKGWDGLGYHFVIGNGTRSGDGQVEVTARWPAQKWGAHAKTADNRFNEQGIGICLVGNFDLDRPTPAQLQSLARLTAHLMQTYRIPAANVVGHRDTKATECPGRYVNLAAVRQMATQALAANNATPTPAHAQAQTASTELLTDLAP